MASSHVIAFGKWMTVKCPGTKDQGEPQTLKVRPLIVDGRTKEYTFGPVHDVTERLFVAQRAFRVNDSLPEDAGLPRWQWQRGGWLLVDRLTGRISAINLAEFDTNDSEASWYRDYVAYCGVSDDGKKISAMVVQLNRRKAVLKKLLSEDSPKNAGAKNEAGKIHDSSAPESACPAPTWQRTPMRVSFEPGGSPKQTFAIHGRAVDLVSDAEDEEEAAR
ncbi:MAG TPA: hypothetical protein VIW68_07400 [Candidatus Sulfotelmatobacter sp.]